MSADLPDELLDVEVEADAEDLDPDATTERPDDAPREQEDEETERFVVFHIGEKLFAVSVDAVKSIVKIPERTRVPRTSPAIDGIMDLRGEITAVIEPRVHFRIDADPAPFERQRIIVFDRTADKQGVGIRVDGVDGVEMFPLRQIVPGDHATSADASHPLVDAVIRRVEDGDVTERIGLLDIKGLIKASGQDATA
ncbi:chemotaxis protein CheW [Haloarchaeobius litoreus]|uniref:Chemotaxis protein CheW n=1 Tax=Haloarchaeobius litoreus TaxID=755306 RepID=A0ABD6DJZ4_9EURY|nr:chemotaxis protein CheW [Haloarchaeobius litoreus]